jgi:HAD superfamily hydrolase (TIGR01509 family)
MIKAVIFDLDGVIVNSEPVHQRLEYEIFSELGLEIPTEMRNSFVGTSSMNMWTRIIERFSLDRKPEELIAMGRGRYLQLVKGGRVPLVEGARELIQRCREDGYKILLASSSTRITIGEVLKWYQLEPFFSAYVGGDQVSRSKPNPEIFLKAAEAGEVAPAACLVIEDAFNGIVAAKEAGMYCIGFQSHYTGDQDLSGADIIVSGLDQITPEIIKSIGESTVDLEPT